MNDAADEPDDEPEYPGSAIRPRAGAKISDQELRSILEKHTEWLAAEDKTGLDHLRADLSQADLRWRDLRTALRDR
jgi:hypothetical protein